MPAFPTLARILVTAAVAFVASFSLYGSPAAAERASLIVDVTSGGVLQAENALRPAYPASLTKLMTLYLAFEALREGRLAAGDQLPVSSAAAAAPPVRLGLKAGTTIELNDAITALIVMSSNDVAAVVAEAISGSEETFVSMMNATATRLGLQRTVFRNASGLPDPAQITTARDMAVLARALYETFPADYERFSTKAATVKGRQFNSHNNFLRGYDGARGLKTGFTCKAGFNLVATAERNERHLIGVVLGAPTAAARDSLMVRLMNETFRSAYDPRFHLDSFPDPAAQGHDDAVNSRMIATECINPQPGREYFKVKDWSILLGGVDLNRRAALDRARKFIRAHRSLLQGGRPMIMPHWARDVVYQVGITGLERQHATNTCLGIRSNSIYCVVRSPQAAEYAMQKALRIMDAVAQRANSTTDAR